MFGLKSNGLPVLTYCHILSTLSIEFNRFSRFSILRPLHIQLRIFPINSSRFWPFFCLRSKPSPWGGSDAWLHHWYKSGGSKRKNPVITWSRTYISEMPICHRTWSWYSIREAMCMYVCFAKYYKDVFRSWYVYTMYVYYKYNAYYISSHVCI